MMDVFKNLPEGTLIQLIENKLIMSPTLLDVHQEVIGEVFLAIAAYVKRHRLGKVRIAPYDVYLDGENAFQPDIVFVSNERLHTIKKNGLHGAPDLVIEILSPVTGKYDEKDKKNVYERCGVKEYWIIDPTDKAVQGFQLVDGSFRALPATRGVINSGLLRTAFHF
jgi:Uma2 family endonuclease